MDHNSLGVTSPSRQETNQFTMQVGVRLDQAAVFAGDEISGDCIASCTAGAEGVVRICIVGRCVAGTGDGGDLCILQSAVAEFAVSQDASSSSAAVRFTCRLPLSICPTYRSDAAAVHYHVQAEIVQSAASEGSVSRAPFRVLAAPPDSEQAMSANWNLFCECAFSGDFHRFKILFTLLLNSPRNFTAPVIHCYCSAVV